jgi:hypothetical protein
MERIYTVKNLKREDYTQKGLSKKFNEGTYVLNMKYPPQTHVL